MRTKVGVLLLILVMLMSHISIAEEVPSNETTTTITVVDSDGIPYSGEIKWWANSSERTDSGTDIITNGELILQNAWLDNGVYYDSLILYGGDGVHANSLSIQIDQLNWTTNNDLNQIQLFKPTLTGIISNEQGPLVNEMLIVRYSNDDIFFTTTDSEGHYAIASTIDGYSGEVSIGHETFSSPISITAGEVDITLVAPRHLEGTVLDVDGTPFNGPVDLCYLSDQYTSLFPGSVENGQLTASTEMLEEDQIYTQLIVIPTDKSRANSIVYDISAYDTTESFIITEPMSVQMPTLTGTAKLDEETVLERGLVRADISDIYFILFTDDNGYFTLAPLIAEDTSDFILSVENDFQNSETDSYTYDAQNIEILIHKTPLENAISGSIKASNGEAFTGYVVYDVYTDNNKFTQFQRITDGYFEIDPSTIEKGATQTYLVVTDSNGLDTNSYKIDLHELDWTVPNNLGDIILNAPTHTVKVIDAFGPVIGADILITFGDDRLEWISDSYGCFPFVPLTENWTGNIDIHVENERHSGTKQDVSFDFETIEFDFSAVPPYMVEIDHINLSFTDNDQPLEGIQIFKGLSKDVLYVPENTSATLTITAYDSDNGIVDISGEAIELVDVSGDGILPIYDPSTKIFTSYETSTGSANQYSVNIKIGDKKFNYDIYNYSGKLGLLNVETPSGDAVGGNISYVINYQSDQGQDGSLTSGYAFDGVLPIPIQDDLVNLEYAYILASPESLYDGEHYGNSEIKDITDAMNDASSEFFDLGTLNFQVADVMVDAYNLQNMPWTDSKMLLSAFRIGEAYGFDNVLVMINSINGKFAVSNFNGGFLPEYSIEISDRGTQINNPYTRILDITGEDITINSIFEILFNKLMITLMGDNRSEMSYVLSTLESQSEVIATSVEDSFLDAEQLKKVKAYGFSNQNITNIFSALLNQKELVKALLEDSDLTYTTYESDMQSIVTAVYNEIPSAVKSDLSAFGDPSEVFEQLLKTVINDTIGSRRKNRDTGTYDSETFEVASSTKIKIYDLMVQLDQIEQAKATQLSEMFYELINYILDINETALKNASLENETAFKYAFSLAVDLNMVTTIEYGTAPDDDSTGGAVIPTTPDSDLNEEDQEKLDEVEDQLPGIGEEATDAQLEAAKDAVDELLDGMDLETAKDADVQVEAVAETVGRTLEVLDGEAAAEVAGEFADLVGAALENPNVSVEEQQEMVENAIENTFSKLASNEAASAADLAGVKEEIATLAETVVKNAATLNILAGTEEDAVEGLKAFELSAKDLASTLKNAVATQADFVKSLEANGLKDVAKMVEKNINLSLPEVKATEQVSIKLDAEAAKSLGDSGVGVTVEAKGVNFKLPAALMKAAKSGLSVASKPVTKADNLNQVTDAGKMTNLKTVNVSVENGKETVKGMVELSFSLADLKDVDLDTLAVGVFEEGQWTKLDYTVENGMVTFTAPHFSIYSLMTFTPSFTDVKASWANKYITSLTARGVVSGKSSTSYDPNGTLTRAEFTTMLVKHLNLTNEVTQNFKDVSSDEWYYTYIGQAGLNSLAVGVESGNFMPNDAITREDMAVMMYRAYKLKNGFNLDNATTPFSDNSKIAKSAREAVYAVRTHGIISGYPDNTFRPEANATRAEAAAMMYLFMSK